MPSTERSPARAAAGFYALAAVMLGSLLAPLLRVPPRDSFPLSTYPMFSYAHQGQTLSLELAVAVLADGSRVAVPPRLIGTEEVMLARKLVRHAVARNQATSFCQSIAARLRAAPDPRLGVVKAIEVRTERFDVFDYFLKPASERAHDGTVHASCPVAP